MVVELRFYFSVCNKHFRSLSVRYQKNDFCIENITSVCNKHFWNLSEAHNKRMKSISVLKGRSMGSDSFWSSIILFCHAIAFKRCIPLILTCILFQCLKEENKNAPSEFFKSILASIVFAWLAVMKGRGPCPINYLLRIGDTHLQILDIGTLVCSTIGSNNFKKRKIF